MLSIRGSSSIAFLCVACGVADAQWLQDSRRMIGDPVIYVEGVEPPLFPQGELIAGLPYDGSSRAAGRAQDYETPFDVYDIFMIEDFMTTEAVSLSAWRSVGVGIGNPFGAEDMVVRIFRDDGSGLPGSESYTGELVLTSSPGEGFWDGAEWVTNFGGQCLPAGSYFLCLGRSHGL